MTPSLAVGVMAAILAALIGTAWQIATRAGVTTSALNPFDLSMLRYGVPALLLAPLLLRNGLWPSTASPWLALPMIGGGGLVFGLLAMFGAQFAPVAHMGALLPGTMPVFAGVLATVFGFSRLGVGHGIGYAMIFAGALLIGARSFATADGESVWIGDCLFLAAAMTWAVYTVSFRASRLDPWHATALVAVASLVLLVPIWLAGGGFERMAATPARDLALQALAQGLMAGLFGIAIFSVSVRHLGPQRGALSGALVPVLAAAGGYVVLGEIPALETLIGAIAIAAGIVVAAQSATPVAAVHQHR